MKRKNQTIFKTEKKHRQSLNYTPVLMSKNTNYFGIDISKDVFDVMDIGNNHYQFENTPLGFKKFFKILDTQSHCVMEATGYYHYRLAYFLSRT